jgi:hypothetical protein
LTGNLGSVINTGVNGPFFYTDESEYFFQNISTGIAADTTRFDLSRVWDVSGEFKPVSTSVLYAITY